MSSTFLQPSEVRAGEQEGLLSTPYYFRDGAYHETCHQETPEAQGAGSIQTSVNDLAKFIRAMINSAGPITDAIYEGVTTPRITKRQPSKHQKNHSIDPPSSYALGWDVHYYRGAQIVSHDGVITGYGSRMFFLPDYKIGAVILGNSDGAFDLGWIIQSYLVDKVLAIPKDQRFDVAISRLKRFTAQETRREKNLKRNAFRRQQSRGRLGIPIEAYLGRYHNRGYRDVTVQEKDGLLCIDGCDRSMPFTMLLEHMSNDTVFRGYLTDETGEDVVPIRFRFTLEGQVSAIGIVFEPILGDEYFIWFDRIQEV
ncbi:beta-lactamase/transpeptidase-like protein, partial [Aureobasidium melanogenum]